MSMIIDIETFVVNAFFVNNHIIVDHESKTFAIIDAPGLHEGIEKLVKEGYKAEWLALTHGHIDHIAGLKDIVEFTGVKWFVHPEDMVFLDHAPKDMFASVLDAKTPPDNPSFFKEGDKLVLGDAEFEIIETPGHTPGGVSIYCKKLGVVFTGDTLFKLSVGRTDLPKGDFSVLKKSILEKLYSLPDNTVVLSGHGETTTIGFEKENNPFVRAE